jgi:DNA-binding transcriptional ArsR family regulator
MKNTVEIFKAISDVKRLRVLMLLQKKELCVCQIMGITGMSQPLISRNLSLLYKAGFLEERKEGKLRFYRIKRDMSDDRKAVAALLRKLLRDNMTIQEDLKNLQECTEFQKMTGKCDMETFTEFIKRKQKTGGMR